MISAPGTLPEPRHPGAAGLTGWPLGAALAALALTSGAAIAWSGLPALYLCLSALGAMLIAYDFRIGVVLLIVLMPISGSAIFPHALFGVTGLNPVNLVQLATLASCLVRGTAGAGQRSFVPPPLLWLYIAPMLVAGAIGVGHVGEIAPGFYLYGLLDFDDRAGYLRDMLGKPLQTVVSALLVAAAVARSDRPERFLAPFVVSIWSMCALAIVFFLGHAVGLGALARSSAREFLSALGMHANELGRLYAFAYALLLFTWAEATGFGLRVVLVLSIALVLVALALTFSRGAYFGAVVVTILFVLWRPHPGKAFVFAFAASIALLLMPDAIYERISAGFGSGLNAISAGRIEGLWLPLLPEIPRQPLLGNGIGSILWSDAMRRGGGATVLGTTHPHNAYLQALLDMGVVGLSAVLAYFLHVLRSLRTLGADMANAPALRGFYQGAAAGLVGFLVSAVADSSLLPKPEQSFLWLAIGAMYGQRRHRAALWPAP